MELTLERYLQDENLRGEIERRAHRERAETMRRFFTQSAQAFDLQRSPELRSSACG